VAEVKSGSDNAMYLRRQAFEKNTITARRPRADMHQPEIEIFVRSVSEPEMILWHVELVDAGAAAIL
jgi:hypothetical protein